MSGDHGLSRQQADELEVALASADPGAVLATGITPSSTSSLLPAGSVVAVDETALAVSGDLATVPAIVAGPSPGRWTLLLAWESGSWRVYGTRPA